MRIATDYPDETFGSREADLHKGERKQSVLCIAFDLFERSLVTNKQFRPGRRVSNDQMNLIKDRITEKIRSDASLTKK